MRIPWFGLLLAAFSISAFAGNISVTDAWIRLLPDNLPLAGYAKVTNTGEHMLTLVAASSPDFPRVQLHRSIVRNGNDVMQHVQKINIAPGQSLNFAPGGYHLMLMGARHSLRIGEHVPIMLKFSDGTHYNILFTVKGATGT